MGMRLYGHKGVLESPPEREKLARQGMYRLMICPHKEDDIESHQCPHALSWIVDFLAQCSRPQIHVFHFFGGVATDGNERLPKGGLESQFCPGVLGSVHQGLEQRQPLGEV